MLAPYLTGLVTGLSLIMVIGVQNALVLRQGLRRSHVALVVAVCAVSDMLLIAAGTAGVGALVAGQPLLLDVLGLAGASYLLALAVRSFRSAAAPQTLEAEPVGRGSVVLAVLGATWLNPHVYLDTVVMLGGIAAQHGNLRWWFAAGAMTASLGWFTALGFGARALARPLGRPATWRVLDVGIGVVMLVVAGTLVLGVLGH